LHSEETAYNRAYDQRQYRQMLFTIDAYKSGRMSIGTLIGNLEALLICLINVSDEWAARFEDSWLDIEIVYALALDTQLKQLSEEQMTAVTETLATIESLVQSVIEEQPEKTTQISDHADRRAGC